MSVSERFAALNLIMKFGGTSVANVERINQVCKLIADFAKEKHRITVVVSALTDVTNQLIEACEMARKGDRKFILNFVGRLRKRHIEACTGSVKDVVVRREVEKTVGETLVELENVLTGIAYLRELTARARDYAVSFGERLSAPIVCGALRSRGVNAEWFTGRDAGIVTDSNFGAARPLMELTVHQVRNRLQNLLERNIVPVVTGFIAADQDGAVTTLGRGGSDYTATILGLALKADEVWIWTDVDGLMTADPKIEPSARTIHQLSYPEAVEMIYFGAKMMHPQALETVMGDNIPIRIRNTFKPEEPGTLITQEQKIEPTTAVKAVSFIRKVALITVSGAAMVGAPGVAAKLFEILGEKHVNVLMISQGSSEANISFAIPRDALDEVLNTLEIALLGRDFIHEIKAEDDVCIVALVGAGMRGTPGVAARIFGAVARENINVRMIAQGSSELNVSFVVKEESGERAVRALHNEFNLGGERL